MDGFALYVTFEARGDRQEAILGAVTAYLEEAAQETLASPVQHTKGYDRATAATWLRLYVSSMDTLNAAFTAEPLEISGQRFVLPERFFTV